MGVGPAADHRADQHHVGRASPAARNVDRKSTSRWVDRRGAITASTGCCDAGAPHARRRPSPHRTPASRRAPLPRAGDYARRDGGPGRASGAGRSMSVRRIMGTEVEYGISVPGQAGANPMVTSSQVVNAYGARPELTRGGRARWDYEEESPLRDARGFTYSGAAYDPAEALADEDLGPGQRHTHQRRPALRRPRPPGVLHPRGHQPAGPGAVGQGRGAGDGRGVPPGRHHPGHPPDPPLQEQHRQQGRQLRRARELPDAPADAVRRHRRVPDAVLRHPADRLRRRPGRHRPGRRPEPASRSPSAPTSSRSRSGWRPPSSGRSSTPATSRTPTPTSTAGCTSSSATPTCRRSPPTSRSAPPRWSSP